MAEPNLFTHKYDSKTNLVEFISLSKELHSPNSEVNSMFSSLDFTTPLTIEFEDAETLKDCTLKLVSFVQRMKYARNYINTHSISTTISNQTKLTQEEDKDKENVSDINLDLTKGY